MKAAKYIIAIVIIIVVAYNSVYFKKLDEVKAAATAKEFNATQYSQNFWTNKLMTGLNKAIELNPNHVESYTGRGIAKTQLKNYKEAIEDFDKAILLNPDFAEASLNREW